jgi:nifR3 family TIM-barrel protein
VSVTATDPSAGAATGLSLGEHRLAVPVVLAPMAGITNLAYRSLCRSFAAEQLAADQLATERPGSRGSEAAPGLFVSEMVTARALVERDEKTLRMVAFAPSETLRSLQLYGVDPATLGRAAAMVRDEGLADHIDLNFGCPVPKVTRKGGGSALPYKRRLFARVVSSVVDNAGDLPVTVKMRKGLDDDHLTYLEAGRIAQDSGVAWVALHARTTLQYYSGHADLDAIAALKEALSIPVLGNGDIWEASDAVAMMRRTGCDGVVVGRGCLGRPWLFAELAAAFSDADIPPPPDLRFVVDVMRRHLDLLVEAFGEHKASQEMRKHIAWYLKGFSVPGTIRLALAHIDGREAFDALVAEIDLDQPFNVHVLGSPRGRTNAAKRIALPEHWLDDPDDDAVPQGADVMHSGG